jgi:hypothetical protein
MFQSKAASDPHARVLVQHSRLSMRVLSGAPVPVSFPAEIAAGAARVGSRGLMFEVRGRTAKGVTVSKCAYLPADAGPPLIKTNLISRPQLRWADPSTETRVAVGFEPWGAGFEQYVVITALRDPATATPGSMFECPARRFFLFLVFVSCFVLLLFFLGSPAGYWTIRS